MVVLGGVFLKFTIHSGIHMVCERIITSISLLVRPISYEYAFDCSGYKFSAILFKKVDINNTSKDFWRKRVGKYRVGV